MTLAKEANSTILDTVATLTAGSTTSASTTVDTSNAVQVAIEVDVTYGSCAKGAQLQCFGSMDNSVWTTKPYAVYDLVTETSTASKQTFGISAPMRYVQCKVYNPDTISVTNVLIKAQRQLVT